MAFSKDSGDSLLGILATCWRSDHPSLFSTNRSIRDVNKEEMYNLRRDRDIVEHWICVFETSNDWAVFDPYNKVWHKLPRTYLPDLRISTEITVICVGYELLFIMYDNSNKQECQWILKFGLTTNQWSTAASTVAPRMWYGSGSEGNTAFIAGGRDSKRDGFGFCRDIQSGNEDLDFNCSVESRS